MFEVFVMAVAFFCPTPDLPTEQAVDSVMQTGWESPSVYGSHPYKLPTTPSEDGTLSYKIAVDPQYRAYAACFYIQVQRILEDPRAWPTIRYGADDETPQVWVVLSPPGLCGPNAQSSCVAGAYGQGEIRMNALRWFGGSDYWGGNVPLFDDRAHVLNHEFGHYFGLGHTECQPDGTTSIMTPSRSTKGCAFISWPTLRADTESHHIESRSVIGVVPALN